MLMYSAFILHPLPPHSAVQQGHCTTCNTILSSDGSKTVLCLVNVLKPRPIPAVLLESAITLPEQLGLLMFTDDIAN